RERQRERPRARQRPRERQRQRERPRERERRRRGPRAGERQRLRARAGRRGLARERPGPGRRQEHLGPRPREPAADPVNGAGGPGTPRAASGSRTEPLVIVVAFDLKDEVEAELRRRAPAPSSGAPSSGAPDDRLEEYDAAATVDAIVAALGRLGHAAE